MAYRGCEICKRPIEAERLEDPTTQLCKEHHEKIQKFGGEFLRSASQERLSKANSLKKNFGGVSVKLRRNQAGLDKLRDEYERSQ